jgi:hypothetical protein
VPAAALLVAPVARPSPAAADARSPVRCVSHVRAVPPSKLPPSVRTWSHGERVFGHGGLWAREGALHLGATKLPDGTRLMKFPWFVIPPGATPTANARRLDGRGTFAFDANVANADGVVFDTSSLMFSTLGCWRVTARYRGSTVTFDVRVRPNPVTG